MDRQELKTILENHKRWLNGDEGESANLSGADLRWADLSSANLSSANLSSADLSGADLRWADLSSANLSSANLRWADLSSANLSSANLSSANLRSANLRSANLRWADLSSANLSSANLRSADLPTKYIIISCIGSRGDSTTYSFAENKIWCGCFTGTLEEFEKQVLEVYPDANNMHHKEYIGAINYIRSLQGGKG